MEATASDFVQNQKPAGCDRERESLLKINRQQRQKISRLREEKRLREKSLAVCERRQAALEKELEELRRLLYRESGRAEAQEQELKELRAYVFGTGERYAVEPDLSGSARRYREWRQRNVVVIGGREGWQRRLRELFPNWRFVCGLDKELAAECLSGKKYIVCNTQALSGGCYAAVIAARRGEQRILYVRNCGMEECLQELERQLERCCPGQDFAPAAKL